MTRLPYLHTGRERGNKPAVLLAPFSIVTEAAMLNVAG